jgi:post-segregation antitoxin (ccd killing protein)|tara:strand:- start:465 stop:626 length:162 start_codon:yes stop_codon:yes gene_type:complete
MQENKPIKTTIYLTRQLHESAKMMAIFTRSNVSTLIRIALQEKLNKLKEQGMK